MHLHSLDIHVDDFGVYIYAENRIYSDAGHSFCPCGNTLFLVEMVDRLGTYPECRAGGDLNRCLLCCDMTIRMSTVGALQVVTGTDTLACQDGLSAASNHP